MHAPRYLDVHQGHSYELLLRVFFNTCEVLFILDTSAHEILSPSWGIKFKLIGAINLSKSGKKTIQSIIPISFEDSESHGAKSSYLISRFNKYSGLEHIQILYTNVIFPIVRAREGSTHISGVDRYFSCKIETLFREKYMSQTELSQDYKTLKMIPLSYMTTDSKKAPIPQSMVTIKIKEGGVPLYRLSIRERSLPFMAEM